MSAPYSAAPGERVVALCGSPNVGKSTIFNHLTGLRQHTGNWSGKTVGCAYGRCRSAEGLVIADAPGACSLCACSAEEAEARDLICFGGVSRVCVVCDAPGLARALPLAIMAMEAHSDVVLCLSLLDEAERYGISPDTERLSRELGIPVVGVSASRGEGLDELLRCLAAPTREAEAAPALRYGEEIERSVATLRAAVPQLSRFLALGLLRGDSDLAASASEKLGIERSELIKRADEARREPPEKLDLEIAEAVSRRAGEIARAVIGEPPEPRARLDRVLTHPLLGLPCMLALLALTLWLTISFANLPSQYLALALDWLGAELSEALSFLPEWAHSAIFDGMWATAARVTSVMLPPMAIFFPLFTLLEDLGYLPRVAFNLDGALQKAHGSGKQALTMCMGLGCNAAGVVGCRIIDSKRERLIAVLTNSFMPCNGRFPALIAVSALFFGGGLAAAGLVSALIMLGVALTLLYSWLLSKTLLRGLPSSFVLELPPYRRADPAAVLLRSVLDRTLFVLRRALAVAAPAGLVIWALSRLGLLPMLASVLDAPGRLIGLDGAILLAFILGLPANELVIPILLMLVSGSAAPEDYSSLASLGAQLAAAGWTVKTALCFLIFMLLHPPCATTLLTVKSEIGSWRYTALAALLPLSAGAIICAAINLIW